MTEQELEAQLHENWEEMAGGFHRCKNAFTYRDKVGVVSVIAGIVRTREQALQIEAQRPREG